MGDETKQGGGGDQGGQGQGPPGSGPMMEQYQVSGAQVQVAMSQAGLPTLAPAPQHGMPQQIQAGQPGQMTIQAAGQPGQPMTIQSMGQPGQPMAMGQFQMIQPMIAPGGQYATFPQVATYDQQGRMVIQPTQFIQQAGQPGQPGQIILSGMPQPQPGKPNMMGSQPSTPGKPISAQPQFIVTSTGQLQMQSNGQPGQQQNFIMAPPPPQMMPGPGPMPGQVTSMPGGHQPQASMAQMKGSDGKPVMAGPPQAMPPQSPQQPILVAGPNGQMMQMMQPGPQPMINGGQFIFRSPAGPGDQQIMFSPSIPATAAPPQAPTPQNLPSSTPMQSPMTMPGQPRPSLPSGPPPGKTAISRAIAPLPSSVTQSGPRMGYTGPAGNLPNQPSPKSKQKMSPRGTNIGPGRPPGPKSVNAPKMMPKMPGSPLATDLLNASSPKPPNLQNEIITSMANIQGPPTLTPMMIPALSTPLTSTQAPPQSMIVTMPSIPVKPLYQMSTATPLPTSSVAPIQPLTNPTDSGPPMLTKEVNPPMPNLGPPNISGPPLQMTPAPVLPKPAPAPAITEPDPSVGVPPKAVVKPQVLTHVIDGVKIKESSTPFPVSPTKTPIKRKSEKDDVKTTTTPPVSSAAPAPPPNTTVPVKRGPGRPPGSSNNKNNQNNDKNKSVGGVLPTVEPPEKKLKSDKENSAVTPLINAPLTPQNNPKEPVKEPPSLISSPKNNPLKWNVQQVCDFIKNLPGCSDYVEDFALQEIDGQALMLLGAEHLMSAMSIKLGPALKICEQVKVLKDEINKN